MKDTITAFLVLLLMVPLAWAEEGPRTGFFKKSITPLELLGEEGAKAMSSVFAPDEKLTWQLSVPKNYDPAKPAGIMVFIGWADWGAGKREWNSVLEDNNIIWIGLIGGGDKKTVTERMLKAILAKVVLEREYKVDPDRHYLFGYSGGAQVAAILATSKPELFKGALFCTGALPWGKTNPEKLDLIRQNRFVFMAGSHDDGKRNIRRAAKSYERAGVVNTKYVLMSNVGRSMPSKTYFEQAVNYLDSRSQGGNKQK